MNDNEKEKYNGFKLQLKYGKYKEKTNLRRENFLGWSLSLSILGG